MVTGTRWALTDLGRRAADLIRSGVLPIDGGKPVRTSGRRTTPEPTDTDAVPADGPLLPGDQP